MTTPSSASARKSRWLRRWPQWVSALLAGAGLSAVIAWGAANDWKLPSFAQAMGLHAEEAGEKWCEAHNVPEEICIECKKECSPCGTSNGWCTKHGVHECPLCHPEVVQLPTIPTITATDRERAEWGLTLVPRTPNESACKKHARRIQFISQADLDRLGVGVQAVQRARVVESLSATGELDFDPTRVVRLAPRLPGTLVHLEKKLGDKVQAGEVLALVDCLEVGKAKAEWQQALVQYELRQQSLARLNELAGLAATQRAVDEAKAAVSETEVRLLSAKQVLANLGFQVRLEEWLKLSLDERKQKAQTLGLAPELSRKSVSLSTSSNLLPILAPASGEIVTVSGRPGEVVEAGQPLFVLADTQRLWLTLHVPAEEADLVRLGQAVHFSHAGQAHSDAGVVSWISPAVEDKTRTVPIRVELPNSSGTHHAKTFGLAQIILRDEPHAIVVPSESVHWEGDCHIVFIRDKDFSSSPYKFFHVRKVRPGTKTLTRDGSMTEILVGVWPGEQVVVANSGLFRSELLKDSLGEG